MAPVWQGARCTGLEEVSCHWPEPVLHCAAAGGWTTSRSCSWEASHMSSGRRTLQRSSRTVAPSP